MREAVFVSTARTPLTKSHRGEFNITPGPTLAPAGSREIAAMVRARGIVVDRVVGGHGGIAAWADVERAGRQ